MGLRRLPSGSGFITRQPWLQVGICPQAGHDLTMVLEGFGCPIAGLQDWLPHLQEAP